MSPLFNDKTLQDFYIRGWLWTGRRNIIWKFLLL